MPAERIAENLAFINWTVLTSLAGGSFAAVALGRLRTSATSGYLGFVAFGSGVLAWLAALSDGVLPVRGVAAIFPVVPWAEIRHAALVGLAIVAMLYVVAIARGLRAPAVAFSGLILVIVAFGTGAIVWGGSIGGSIALFIQFGLLAGATGGVLATMILGHWYLVTPKLGEAPLILFARVLTLVIGGQLGLFILATGLGIGPSGTGAFGALTGTWALFVWLRLVVGILFPLIVSWAAIQTARTRSMESATGLLYISVGTIAAGTILASGLYFGAGLLV